MSSFQHRLKGVVRRHTCGRKELSILRNRFAPVSSQPLGQGWDYNAYNQSRYLETSDITRNQASHLDLCHPTSYHDPGRPDMKPVDLPWTWLGCWDSLLHWWVDTIGRIQAVYQDTLVSNIHLKKVLVKQKQTTNINKPFESFMGCNLRPKIQLAHTFEHTCQISNLFQLQIGVTQDRRG